MSESGVTFGLVDVTKPGPGQILVKVVAAAQNPVDGQFSFSTPLFVPYLRCFRELTDILIANII